MTFETDSETIAQAKQIVVTNPPRKPIGSCSDPRSLGCDVAHRLDGLAALVIIQESAAPKRKSAVTETGQERLNATPPSGGKHPLTKEQIFQLWKCAIKDDDRLLDAVIQKLYDTIIAFDFERAENVIRLIIDRDEAAERNLRGMLQEIDI
jgi:hypothetical protein